MDGSPASAGRSPWSHPGDANGIALAQAVREGMRIVSGKIPTDEGNAAVVQILMEEVLGAGRMPLLPELVAPDYVGHLAIGDHFGPEGVRIEFTAYRTAIVDLVVTLDDLFASNGRVARRFTLRGTSRSSACTNAGGGHPVALHGIAIDRLEKGRLVESWIQVDDLTLTL